MAKLPAKSLTEVQQYVGKSIETLKAVGASDMLQLAMSTAEYLKDAARWQYARGHNLPDGPVNESMDAWVDGKIAELAGNSPA